MKISYIAYINFRSLTSPPKVTWKEHVALAQLHVCNKVPSGYNGRPWINSPPKLPLPFHDHHPYPIHPSLDRPTHYRKRHPDSISHFATVHFPDRQSNRQTHTHRTTDGLGDSWTPLVLTLVIFIESDALIIARNACGNVSYSKLTGYRDECQVSKSDLG